MKKTFNSTIKKPAFFIVLTALLIAPIFAQTPDFREILHKIDDMSEFENTDFSCEYKMISKKPGEPNSVYQLKLFRRDSEDKFLLLILKPEVEKGKGYLQVGDNAWSYDPESREFAHFSMKDNFEDSEAKNRDFKALSYAEDYSIIDDEEGTLGKYSVYILTLEGKHDDVVYPKIKMWIRQDNHLLLKEEDYSLSDRLMRTLYYPSYIKIDDRYIAGTILFVDNLKEGEKTQITISDPSLAELPEYVFTKSYLERVNR